MESIRYDLAPFGISTTVVEPGFFRTELLVEGASAVWPELSVPDYAEPTTATIEAWKRMNGTQSGDPKKLAAALITILDLDEPPLRWLAGAGAVQVAEHKGATLRAQADAFRALSTSLDHDGA